jgi:hypothetical protein
VEEVAGVAGLGEVLQQVVELVQRPLEVVVDVLELLVGPLLDDVGVHPG